MAVFWVVAPCSLVEVLPDYMALQPTRQPSSFPSINCVTETAKETNNIIQSLKNSSRKIIKTCYDNLTLQTQLAIHSLAT
jgi:hypothetical protein